MKKFSDQSDASVPGPEDIELIHEDNHLYVVDKPCHLPTMGAAPGMPTLLEYGRDDIRRRYRKPGNVYLGVVSRLDSLVGGVIVFARTSKAAARLSKQFRERTVSKTYHALIKGRPPVDQGRLEHWLRRDDRIRRTLADSQQHPDAEFAALHYVSLGTKQGQTLIRIGLETGRRHQIRAQLATAGMPVTGDRKYGSRVTFPCGIALHSTELAIDHPTTGRRLTFHSPFPTYWPRWSRLLLGNFQRD